MSTPNSACLSLMRATVCLCVDWLHGVHLTAGLDRVLRVIDAPHQPNPYSTAFIVAAQVWQESRLLQLPNGHLVLIGGNNSANLDQFGDGNHQLGCGEALVAFNACSTKSPFTPIISSWYRTGGKRRVCRWRRSRRMRGNVRDGRSRRFPLRPECATVDSRAMPLGSVIGHLETTSVFEPRDNAEL